MHMTLLSKNKLQFIDENTLTPQWTDPIYLVGNVATISSSLESSNPSLLPSLNQSYGLVLLEMSRGY